MDLERLGALLGIAAFLGLAILVLLVIQQARDLRRLRRWAGTAPERAIAEAEEKGEEIPEPEHNRLVRPLIRLGAWIHDTTARGWARVREVYSAADRRSPIDLRFILGFLAVVVVAGLVVLTSGFGLYGEDDGPERRGKAAPDPQDVRVAVLNGTAGTAAAVPGFASGIAKEVRQAGYDVIEVADTNTSFVETVVMYAPGQKAAARGLAGDLDSTLGRTSVQGIIAEVEELAGRADLALVLGADDAPEGAVTEAQEAPAPEAPAPAPAPTEPVPTG